MGTKNEPGKYDCFAKAEDDEPMFTLLARDPLAAKLVRRWAAARAGLTGYTDKVSEALRCADAMDQWRATNCVTHQPSASTRPDYVPNEAL